MPDTGAPWNIPYVEPSDLVRTYPAADELQALAIAAGLTAAGSAGIGDNTVSTVKANTFTTSSATYADVTDLAVTITPTSDTSKVLLVASVLCQINGATNQFGYLNILRGVSSLISPTSPGSRTVGITAGPRIATTNGDFSLNAITFAFLDSPATASAVTYQVQARVGGNTLFVNRTATDTNSADFTRGVSTITAIEVAA